MADRSIRIAHMFPEVLNLYGDRGNIICLKKRLEWRGIGCDVTEVKLGDQLSLSDFDLFFIGGGQDFEQEVLLSDLKAGKGDNIKAAIEDGKTFLCICGGYQMMGHYYETKEGEKKFDEKIKEADKGFEQTHDECYQGQVDALKELKKELQKK